MIAFVFAATLSFAWDSVSNATSYALYLNDQMAYFGSNAFCTVQAQPLVIYRAEATALNEAGESDRSEPLTALVRPVTLYFERSQSIAGPWQTMQTNTAYMTETGPVRFYRARMAVAP